MDVAELVRTAAAVLGAASVVVAARSFRLTKEQARTTFEDSLAREYRDITGSLPPAAFYRHGRVELSDAEKQAVFRYFDLSNEQLRLIEEKRIRPKTARVWESGIKELIGRETFGACWVELHQGLPSNFFMSLDEFLARHKLLGSSEELDPKTPGAGK